MLKSFYKLNLIKAIEWWKTTSRLQVASPLQNIFKFMQFPTNFALPHMEFCFSYFGDKRDFPQKTPSQKREFPPKDPFPKKRIPPKRTLPHLVIKAMP